MRKRRNSTSHLHFLHLIESFSTCLIVENIASPYFKRVSNRYFGREVVRINLVNIVYRTPTIRSLPNGSNTIKNSRLRPGMIDLDAQDDDS